MNIAIIGAMQEEIDPILNKIKDYKKVEFGSNTYYMFKYKNNDIVLAYSKIGKVNAAITATTMVLKFKCEIAIFSGVAGGINNNLKIGDVIIASRLVQHDLDISAFGHPLGYVPGGKIFIETSERLNNIAQKSADKLNIQIQKAIIATGDQFIANNEKKEWIQKTFNADAIEMEGCSVANVFDSFNIPFCVIRSISDSANNEANISFDKFLESSAKRGAELVFTIIDSL